jgi:NAD(P)-dependent dehydrogenase (short-subunit alcohol dehydrogenase family)
MTRQQEPVALVTGAGSGIGRAIASALAEGWIVYATDVTTDRLTDMSDCETARLDVTDNAAIERVLDRIRTAHGGVDCLVNNAGYAEVGPVEDVPIDAVADQFDVNLYGPLRLCSAVLPGMRERGRGRIINVSSIFGQTVLPGMGVYSASKFGIEAVSDALRRELVSSGVAVVVVEPAWVRTDFAKRARHTLADRNQTQAYDALYQVLERTPFLDGGALAVSPEAVAETVQTAATTADPDSRYAVGPQARLLRATGALPDRVLDLVSRGLLGVGRLLGRKDR